jgi:hypothetical protein
MSNTLNVNDVFISYAHIDDLPARGVKYGWVSTLHYNLERALSRQLGGNCPIWFDQSELRGNHSVTPEIAGKVTLAKTLVIVLSKSYLSSEWCRRELSLFRQAVNGARQGRLFVVNMAGLGRDELNSLGLGDLNTYHFWYRDEAKRIRTYGAPAPRPDDEPEYYNLLDDLASDIADVLKGAAPPPVLGLAAPGTSSSTGAGTSVLLAEVTDDLETLRQQVRRCLEQAGHKVYLSQSFGKTIHEFQREFQSDLAESSIFVQLLSSIPSRSLEQLPEGYAVWQHRCAQKAGVRIMQWRDPLVEPRSVDDKLHRALLLHDSVLAVSLDSFKRHLLEAATATTIVSPIAAFPRPLSSMLFVSAEKRDLHIANQIKEYFGTRTSVYLPAEGGKPEELRLNVEANIVECDSLLVVYGDGGAAWVQQQLRLYNKLAPRRERPIKLLAVLDAPPDGKPGINVQIPGMQVFDCRTGVNEAALSRLSTYLQDTIQ